MPSTKSASKRESRSRSTSRSRQRSTSRSRKPSRSRRSTTPSSSVSGDNEKKSSQTAKRSTSKSSSKSTTKSTPKPNDLKSSPTVPVDKKESPKVSKKEIKENEEKKGTRRETVSRRSVTTTVTKEEEEDRGSTRMSTRLRERKGVSTTTSMTLEDAKAVPKTKDTLYFGPLGTTILIFAIPLLSIYLQLMCTKRSCTPRLVSFPNRLASYFDLKTMGVYIGWIIFQALLCLAPCGRVYKGTVTRSGVRLNYRCNGFIGLLITLTILAITTSARYKWPDYIPSPTYVLDHFLALHVAAILFALTTGILAYIYARIYCGPRALNRMGNNGCWPYDAFVGHEMHPRLKGGLDLKFFTYSRLSQMTQAVLIILMCLKEYESRGGWSKSAPMHFPLLAVALQQLIFITSNLFFEEDTFLHTFSMQQDGFGLLHCFSRIVWIPFIMTMPVRYLSNLGPDGSPQWPSYAYVGIILLHLASFIIFRGSVSQKADYRREPNHPAFSSLDTISTSHSSKRLLSGGWWGIVRHPNYVGHLMFIISWTLPVGLGLTTPWLCPLIFLFISMVRIRIVEADCRRRYGSGWQRYCEKVRSRLIPYIL